MINIFGDFPWQEILATFAFSFVSQYWSHGCVLAIDTVFFISFRSTSTSTYFLKISWFAKQHFVGFISSQYTIQTLRAERFARIYFDTPPWVDTFWWRLRQDVAPVHKIRWGISDCEQWCTVTKVLYLHSQSKYTRRSEMSASGRLIFVVSLNCSSFNGRRRRLFALLLREKIESKEQSSDIESFRFSMFLCFWQNTKCFYIVQQCVTTMQGLLPQRSWNLNLTLNLQAERYALV